MCFVVCPLHSNQVCCEKVIHDVGMNTYDICITTMYLRQQGMAMLGARVSNKFYILNCLICVFFQSFAHCVLRSPLHLTLLPEDFLSCPVTMQSENFQIEQVGAVAITVVLASSSHVAYLSFRLFRSGEGPFSKAGLAHGYKLRQMLLFAMFKLIADFVALATSFQRSTSSSLTLFHPCVWLSSFLGLSIEVWVAMKKPLLCSDRP